MNARKEAPNVKRHNRSRDYLASRPPPCRWRPCPRAESERPGLPSVQATVAHRREKIALERGAALDICDIGLENLFVGGRCLIAVAPRVDPPHALPTMWVLWPAASRPGDHGAGQQLGIFVVAATGAGPGMCRRGLSARVEGPMPP